MNTRIGFHPCCTVHVTRDIFHSKSYVVSSHQSLIGWTKQRPKNRLHADSGIAVIRLLIKATLRTPQDCRICSSPVMLVAKLAAGAKTPERNLPDPHGDSVLMYILPQIGRPLVWKGTPCINRSPSIGKFCDSRPDLCAFEQMKGLACQLTFAKLVVRDLLPSCFT
jgi:hypothetical protein